MITTSVGHPNTLPPVHLSKNVWETASSGMPKRLELVHLGDGNRANRQTHTHKYTDRTSSQYLFLVLSLDKVLLHAGPSWSDAQNAGPWSTCGLHMMHMRKSMMHMRARARDFCPHCGSAVTTAAPVQAGDASGGSCDKGCLQVDSWDNAQNIHARGPFMGQRPTCQAQVEIAESPVADSVGLRDDRDTENTRLNDATLFQCLVRIHNAPVRVLQDQMFPGCVCWHLQPANHI